MNKFFIYFFLIGFLTITFVPSGFCADKTQIAEISKIENDIYGFDYISDELNNRVARLEKSIYGKSFTGDLSNRIKKLAKDINAEQIGLEIPPSEDTYMESEDIADNTVDYPVVNEVEQKLFGTTYKNRDFHTRIVTIERKLFGKIYDVEDYSTRMDRIKTAVMPNELLADKDRFNYDNNNGNTYFYSEDLGGTDYNRYGSMPYGQRNYTRPYQNFGEFAHSAPATGNLNDELAQLEYDTFGTEFSSDDTKTRVKRLNSVNKAKKSYKKYDSQRFQQHMSTAMEIGAMLLMILAMVL